MNSFNEVFGGSNIYVSNPTYLLLDPLDADVTLDWPVEQAIAGALVVADIMDINPTAPGLTVMLPDARQASEGFTALFNNIGAETVDILDATGGVIVSLVSGTVWQAYLTDNTTEAGTWRIFQFGASVSTAVAAALAGAGLKAISTTLNERMIVVARTVDYAIVNADRANVQQWTSGVGTFTLPDPATVGSDWFTIIKNSGSGNLTVDTIAGNIDGSATATLAPGDSVWVVTDGADYYTLAGSSSSSGGSGFNLITIDVSGSGNFVLSGVQLNQIGYKFIGVLTGTRNIIVPGTTQEYWVDNETTGAFDLQVQTAGQVSPAPPVVVQGARNILYCDGTSVVAAETATVSFPIAVVQGGTGSTTASGARTNLGATTVGNAIFTAASVAAAQAALSVPPNSRLISSAPSALLSGGGDLSADRTITLNMLGVVVTKSGVFNTTLNTYTPVSFDTEVTDQGGWHDNVTNNTRLTIPAGVSWAEIEADFTWQSGNPLVSGTIYFFEAIIKKNGVTNITVRTDMMLSNTATSIDIKSLHIGTGPIAVVPGDYFEIYVKGQDASNTIVTNCFGPLSAAAPFSNTQGIFTARALG